MITLIAQAQQLSTQVMSMEQGLSQKVHTLREDVDHLCRKRTSKLQASPVPPKRRRLESSSALLPTEHRRSGNRAPSKMMSSTFVKHNHRLPCSDIPSPNALEQDRVALSIQATNRIAAQRISGNRIKKAQKLALFLGDSESYEEEIAEDLFSKF
ncbi:hypothetical protein CPB86DRAFT_782286 [Serendipita vermifera]|nr:hypothetical protein CPB86DRAFT_782286 [Serendipita vermifera]